MIKVTLDEAARHLRDLVEEAAAGGEVVITAEDGSTVQLVPVAAAGRQERAGRGPRTAGDALNRFIGSWSAEQVELLRSIDVCRRGEDPRVARWPAR